MKSPYPPLLVLGPYGQRFWAGTRARLDARIEVLVDNLVDASDLPVTARRIVARAPARFALLGFCMGGYLAFELLRAVPDRISRLALVSTAATADTPAQAAMRAARIEKLGRKMAGISFPDPAYVENAMKWLLSGSSLRSPATIRAVRELLSGIPLRHSINQQRAMAGRVDSQDLLPRITAPTLVVVGREDRIVRPPRVQEMGRAIPGARVHVLESCGHLVPLEAPAQLAALVERWLEPELEGPRSSQANGEMHVATG